ncbi:MAG: LuxR C-terminal-related transcriptional regulator [Desulfobacterales bacterium]|nr:LuxR C-terminal-related transcriptional regulator [Desulfobacterales bacterium]
MPSRESKVFPPVMTRRERSILYLIAEGYKNQEIADELTISEKTVRGTQVNLMRKWNAPNVSSVIDHALEEGWISLYEVLESRFSKRNAQAN